MIYPRRLFIRGMLRAGGVVAASLLSGCTGKSPKEQTTTDTTSDPCADLTGVGENDVELRRKFAYVSESPIGDNQCGNCNLYLPPKEGSACGGCMLFKGPVHATGYCTYWAPRI